MTTPDTSLKGYSSDIHRRDDYTCQYCGLDGKESFDNWLFLSGDHLLPTGHPHRDDKEYIVTACRFCNEADNHYFLHAEERGLKFDGMTPEQLVEQRRPYVETVRKRDYEYWVEHVKKSCPT